MRKIVKKFGAFKDSEDADRAYYLGLTGQERLDILLDLIARYRDEQGEAARGFKRVYRIIKLGER